MDDFRPRRPSPAPPRRPGTVRPNVVPSGTQVQPSSQSLRPPTSSLQNAPAPSTADGNEPSSGLSLKNNRPKKTRKRLVLWVSGGILVLLVVVALGGLLWYQQQLSPVNKDDTSKKLVVIKPGTTPDGIASDLAEQKVIRSERAFLLYTKLTKTQNVLQAGSYRLSPSESTPQIVEHLTKGNVDTFELTFLPGATLAQNKKVFLKAGYSEAEVDIAFKKTYDSPLFEGKPSSADLEGYIFGNTYRFGAGTSVEEVLKHIFALYNEEIENNNIAAKLKAKGLTLYEGITLASIIQRESAGGDEAQIAQVFYTRLAIDMPLGSDVTYQYIADKTGVARDPNLDSPYNTRRYKGLPPGPIAVPGVAALKAAANPAPGDYVYFLSGDDDVTYFARTLQEHEANIQKHCQEKCKII